MLLRYRTLLCFLILPFIVSACGGIKTYRSSLAHNLTVNTTVDSVTASMDLYEIDSQCRQIYLGSVKLTEGISEIAIPPNKDIYSVVAFESFSLLGGSSRVTSDALISVRKGRHYEMDVRYLNTIFSVTAYEVDDTKKKKRQLPEVLNRCGQH